MDVLPVLQGYPIDPTVRRRAAATASRRRRAGGWRRLTGLRARRRAERAVAEGPFLDGPIAHRATR